MDIIIYNTKDDSRVVDKTLVEVVRFSNVTLKESTGVTNPTIVITGVSVDDVSLFNYCRIPKFGRNYFINEITAKKGKVLELSCHVDVLTTYKDDILKSKQLIERQENVKNSLLVDDMLPLANKREIIGSNVGDVLDEDSNYFILTTIGGVSE